MKSKRPIQSKNLWFNILTILAMVGGSLLADETFRELVGAKAIFVIIAVNVINMIIRFYTVEPIKVTSKKKELNPLEQALKDEAEEHGMR